MRTVMTAKIQIIPTKQIVATIKAYTNALRFCIDYAWQHNITQNFKLHYAIYQTVRKRFKLPSQIAVACLRQACSMIKTSITSFNNLSIKRKKRLKEPTKPSVKNVSVSYNFPRSANLKDNILVIRTLTERQKFPIKIPSCYKEYFTWGKPDESLLQIDKKGKCFFLFTFSKEVAAIEQNNSSQNIVLGIDLGVNNLAVTSDGRFYNSAKVKQIKRKFKYLRNKLQAKGTRSTKRLLKQLSGRETRYMAWINHNISKDIVSSFPGYKIIMEDLKGIRKKRRGKVMNYWISNWSFFQLQSFIEYKAIKKGIITEYKNPFMTSQIHYICGNLGTRFNGTFSCLHCGLSGYSADLNAARNLAHPMLGERQGAVKHLYSRGDDVKGISQDAIATELMAKQLMQHRNAPGLAPIGIDVD